MLSRLYERRPVRAGFAGVAYRYRAHAGSRTMGGTWLSYGAVHRANLVLAGHLSRSASDPERREMLAAFAAGGAARPRPPVVARSAARPARRLPACPVAS
jgi:hypothetical protein